MKRALVAGAVVAAACGHRGGASSDDACARLVDHLAGIMSARADQQGDAIARCQAHRPAARTIDCAMAAATPDAVTACLAADPSVTKSPAASYDGEWPRVANQLAEKVGLYYALNHRFPPGAGPTPAADACCQAPCAPDPSRWTGAWQTLGFAIAEPSRYAYRYELIDPARGGVIHAMRACGGAVVDKLADVGVDGGGNIVFTPRGAR